MSTPTDLRIGDNEREQAVSALGEHYLAGRITKDEYDERTAAAWSAKTASALSPLFWDLPPLHQKVATQPPKTPARTRSRRGRRFPVFPIVAIFVLVMVFTPLHLPWWGWLIFAWLWFSGVFGYLATGHRRRRC